MEQVMLDMIPTGAKAVCHVSQYDIGRTIRFNLISGGAVYMLSGTETVKVYIKKPDGTTAERNIANTSSTYVDWVTGEGDCDQAGECECELVITSGTTVIGSKNFTVKIEEDPYNEQGVVTETAGPAVIATFTTNVVDLLQEIKCSVNPIQNGTPWIDSNEVNKEPYIKRAVAGTASRIGNHLYDKLVGGTVAFNQLVKNGNFADSSNWNAIRSTLSVSNNVGTITKSDNNPYIEQRFNFIAGHKYLYNADLKANNGTVVLSAIYDNESVDRNLAVTDETWTNAAFIITPSTTGTNNKERYRITLRTGDTAQVKNAYLIDLTAMFGSTIADYIYSLEQATAGAGVAWFKALFPNDYYAYNAGELMSVKATAHVMKNASNTVIGNYALDSNLELRGIPKLVNNKLEYDGDTYESNGKVTRKFIKLIFNGSENWQIYEGDGINQLYVYIDNIKTSAQGITTICAKYRPISINDRAGNYNTCYTGSGSVSFNVEGYTVETWKAFLSNNNIEIVCELVTPTTESASPFTNPQVCDENGTEEYTDSRSVAIPVGHETYQANICEITGFDELNVVRTGANIWDEEWEIGRFDTTTGANVTSTTQIRTKNKFRIKGGANYYINMTADAGRLWCIFYDKDENVIPTPTVPQATQSSGNSVYLLYEFTAPTEACYMRFYCIVSYGTTYNNDISINYPSSDHEYHSYSGKLIKLEFDDTVFLAEVSCLNGVWKLKLLGAEVDLGDLSWYPGACALENKYTMRSDGIANLVLAPPSSSVIVDILCPIYPTIIGDSTCLGNTGISILRGGTLAVFDDRYSTIDSANAFKSAMSGVKLVYPLATPTEITLDETEQFESLIGVNNIWHDGNGDTEVKYLYNA